jgi:hypothetical protein
MSVTTTTANRQPWGRACGLLAGCVATVVGVLREVDPDVILYRAMITAVVVAVAVRMVRSVMEACPAKDDEDE